MSQRQDTSENVVATFLIHRLSAQEVSHAVITAAMKVHSELGAGLLESAYQACLHHELHQACVQAACQVGLPVVYRGVKLEIGYRIDLLVEDLVIKLSGRSLGLLINFNVVHLRDGIKRFVSGTGWKENQTVNH